jgi:hypothetical protein
MFLPSFQDPGAGFTTKLQALEKVVICLIELREVSFLSSMKLHASITRMGLVSDLNDLMSRSSLIRSMLLIRKKESGT